MIHNNNELCGIMLTHKKLIKVKSPNQTAPVLTEKTVMLGMLKNIITIKLSKSDTSIKQIFQLLHSN